MARDEASLVNIIRLVVTAMAWGDIGKDLLLTQKLTVGIIIRTK